ncbi:MAG: prenyltransferase [Candidatus Omnitrophota bacterium]
MLSNIVRALRLPFILASILPFVFGSLIARKEFNPAGFTLGLLSVIFTHLSANLINDYFDSRSGADWPDKDYYGFFGGSKLIQEGVFSERSYLVFAVCCAAIASVCVILLALSLRSSFVIVAYLLIMILSWQYTAKPLAFSYNYLGELFLFVLFGPALVMGGYFIQSGAFPEIKSLILSLPFGFFTAGILFVNEVPDFPGDKKSGKNNLVSIFGVKRAYLFYYLLAAAGFLSIFTALGLGYLGFTCVFSLLVVLPVIKTGRILKINYSDKLKLVLSSKTAINIQVLIGVILILSLWV